MRHYPNQGQTIPMISRHRVPKYKRSVPRDRFFHLPTALAVNDPFLRRLYGVVIDVLDDHPYPSTPDEFRRRTREIKRDVQNLNLPPDQQQFIQRLMSDTGVSVVDLWQGSHIITLDQGYLYGIWSQLPSARSRFSSHYGQVPVKQYGISFHDHQLLFGKTAVDGSTWFQMEAHSFEPNHFYNDPDNVVYHGQDFLKYRVHRMNVGPFGFSPHTEQFDPIVAPFRPMGAKSKKRLPRIDQSRFRFFY